MPRLFSIIIPTCHRNDMLAQCLNRLAPGMQTLDAALYEVIVTDDGPNNEAKELIEKYYPWVQWTAGPKRGPAANRNNAAKLAITPWLIFLDDDCVPSTSLLHTYQAALAKHTQVKVFEGSIASDREKRNFLEESPINLSGNRLWSCNFMIEKKLFRDTLSGFDEGFPFAAMEDVDLHYRITQHNSPTLFLQDAFVIHPWRTQKHLVKATLRRFQSMQFFLKKHPEKKTYYNSRYYITAFYHSFFKDTLKNVIKYKGKGLFQKICYDFLQIAFALRPY